MKFPYTAKLRLSAANKQRLRQINTIIEEYRVAGHVLTLRQLYYQLVSRAIIPNKQSEYSKLSTLLTQGRMAGHVDWDAIEDRTRQPYILDTWTSPEDILNDAVRWYRRDRMEEQHKYVEMWVEKDALSAVLKKSTNPYGVPVMVNRGYSSTSAMHDAFERFVDLIINDEREVVILYLGDHDPSGMDMARDIYARLEEFFVGHQRAHAIENGWEEEEADNTMVMWSEQFSEHFKIERIGLNMDQIRAYRPPPNPAKITDPRAQQYIREFGPTSWEVDALKPEVLHELVQNAIKKLINQSRYKESVAQEQRERELLQSLVKSLKKGGKS